MPSRKRHRARLPPRPGRPSSERYFVERAEAEAWLARELGRDADTFDPSRPLGDYLDHWRHLNESRWLPLTQRRYRIEASACRPIGHVPLEGLRGDHVQQLVTAILARKTTRRYAHNVAALLRRALADAVRWGILDRNPADGERLPSPEPPHAKAWDTDERRRVRAAMIGHRYEAVYLLWLEAGLRMGESLAALWGAIDWQDGSIAITQAEWSRLPGRPFGKPKRERERVALISGYGLARLRAIRDGLDPLPLYIAGKPDGGRVTSSSLRTAWQKVAKVAGVRVMVPHESRHTHLSHLIEAGVPPADVAAQAGHAHAGVTLGIYSHPSRSRAALRAALSEPESADAVSTTTP